MDPVDGEVAAGFLCGADELAAQLGPGGLRRGVDSGLDVLISGDPRGEPLALQQTTLGSESGQVTLKKPARNA